ncbi:hypothetical protein HYE50_04705 [Mycoplasmopsis bovis]|nr:hypothetical protein HYE50_04705 [Mycoplasmopsis bovis]
MTGIDKQKDKDEEIKSLNSELKELEKSIDEEDKSDEIYNFKENKWKCNNIKKSTIMLQKKLIL